MRVRQRTWIQRAPSLRELGMGIAPGDIGFTGPLTPDQQATLDANQTQNIANFFYQQGQMSAQSTGLTFQDWISQNWMYVAGGLVGIVVLKRLMK